MAIDEKAVVPPIRRRSGWQLPTVRRSSSATRGSPLPPPDPDATGRDPGAQEPPRSLRGSVVGQVTEVVEGSVQVNQMVEPIVTFRLERRAPHGGLVFVDSVRLAGADALGFVSVGDWVEAVGKRENAHLVASHCVNHTTRAVYKRSALYRHRVAIALAVFLVIAAVMVGGFLFLADRGLDEFDRRADEQQQEFERRRDDARRKFVEQCIASGAPRSFCEQGG